MNTFKVTFNDGNSLVTGFNGTLAEAEAYYFPNVFNFGDVDCPDKLVHAIAIEQL